MVETFVFDHFHLKARSRRFNSIKFYVSVCCYSSPKSFTKLKSFYFEIVILFFIFGITFQQMASLGPSRKSSRASMGSIGPQGLCPNGAYSSIGLSNPHFAAMASSQNLPAVLNDPRKGEICS